MHYTANGTNRIQIHGKTVHTVGINLFWLTLQYTCSSHTIRPQWSLPEDIALSKYKGIHLNENANSFSQILISIKFNTDVVQKDPTLKRLHLKPLKQSQVGNVSSNCHHLLQSISMGS